VVTQTLTVGHEIRPSSLVVSAVTVDQELPASAVPASEVSMPAPAAQQFWVLAHEIESSQPVSSNCPSCAQVAPPSCELSTVGTSAVPAHPVA
jgi:hypothetical protein